MGAGTLALFLVHHLLNRRWYPALARGPWTVLRRLTALVNGLLLLDMAGLLVSGVLLSNHVFAFLGLTGGTGTVRLVHMAASHWGFLLMSFHLGLHWGGVLARGRRWLALPPPSPRRARIGTLLGAAVAVYGLTVFFRRDFPTYLFLRSQFVFLDFSESPLVFYGDHLALMGTFVFLGCPAAGEGLCLTPPPRKNCRGTCGSAAVFLVGRCRRPQGAGALAFLSAHAVAFSPPAWASDHACSKADQSRLGRRSVQIS